MNDAPKKIVVFFAHPDFDHSRTNRALKNAITDLPFVTFHDLYEAYPDLLIDVKREQSLAIDADLLVFQHPFYWYSSPAIIKQWYDMVLERGWAYGDNGTKLKSKDMLITITTGGPDHSYLEKGSNNFTIDQFLTPQHQTASLCGMHFLDPFIVYSARSSDETARANHGQRFRDYLINYAENR